MLAAPPLVADGREAALDRLGELAAASRAENGVVGYRVFQSLPISTRNNGSVEALLAKFQPQSELSRRLDHLLRSRDPYFNPALDFLPALTVEDVPADGRVLVFQSRFRSSSCLIVEPQRVGLYPDRVSIPIWVFSLSRQDHGVARSALLRQFQSRSGFSPCLDSHHRRVGPRGVVSNPALGFLPVSTRRPRLLRAGQAEFQSRSGFSPCLDI